MKLREMTVLTCFFCLLAVVASHGQEAPAESVILPGKSVAGVELGATLASFWKIFPKHEGADEELPVNGCGVGGYHWVDVDRGATGVYAYLKNDKIYQLSVHTPRFALPNGLKVEVPEEQVKRSYPSGQGYVLLHSGSAVVGGRDLVYWVDKESGVAFELYWNQRKKQRLVNGIDVFKKGIEYYPEGCISPPQQWKELKPSQRK
jgi:hypothetical protein